MAARRIVRDSDAEQREPAIIGYNRLEPRPRSVNFERSLRAEVRDALWMLTRQWQVGEFRGEDAASPVFAQLKVDNAPVVRFRAPGQSSVSFDQSLPLETRVEREAVAMDLHRRVELGQLWMRLLGTKNLSADYRALYRAVYPLSAVPLDVSHANDASDRTGWLFAQAAAGRAIDGGALVADILGGVAAESVSSGALQVAAQDRAGVAQAAAELLAAHRRLVSEPGAGAQGSCWIPERLEYQFACTTADADGGATTLVADEYYQGNLDWYAFDVGERTSPTRKGGQPGRGVLVQPSATDHTSLGNTPAATRKTLTFFPSPVEFAGAPNQRWWELEDRRIAFGKIDANTTDVAQLLFVEFALVYGNDWSIVPFEVPAGSLCQVHSLIVTDVFGDRTLVRAAGAGDASAWERWSMFTLAPAQGAAPGTVADTRLFVPPTLGKSQDGPDVEVVRMVRDEVGNYVWGIEATLPNALGDGTNGFELATALRAFLESKAPPPPPDPNLVDTGAAIRYLLATTVPENWIPFISVHVPNSQRETQLQRAAMPRIIPGLAVAPVAPRGKILQPQPASVAPYFVYEEEVPRAGVSVSRAWQRTRWTNGETFLWMGRRKTTGRGEGTAGLQFDQVLPT